MKRIIVPIVLILCLLLVSCVSSDLIRYSDKGLTTGNIIIEIDQNSYSLSGIGYGYSIGSSTLYASSTETIKLGTIENKEIVKNSFISKGYNIVNNTRDADYAVVIESTSNEDLAIVSIGFYEISTNQLLFVCEGKYGLGWGFQDDLNNALIKALDAVPYMK